MLVVSWVITLYTLWQMVEMHEMVPGRRFDRYHELGQYAFGERLGLWIVVPQQLIVEIGTNIVYMVTGGRSLMKFHDLVCADKCKDIRLSHFIMIFASAHFLLSQCPNFNSISLVSFAAAVMSLTYVLIKFFNTFCSYLFRKKKKFNKFRNRRYSTIAWTAALGRGKQPDVDYAYRSTETSSNVYGFLGGLGEVAFAYAGHNVVLEIQATIPSTPEKPSKKPMWKGVLVAYMIVAVCYFPVALIGYWAFGNSVEDNILISLEKPRWLIACANMFVVIHVVGSYQVYIYIAIVFIFLMLLEDIRYCLNFQH